MNIGRFLTSKSGHRHNPTEEDPDDKLPQVGTKAFVEQIMNRPFPNAADPGGAVDVVEKGKDLTLPFLSSSGFSRPILIPHSEGLGLTVPEHELNILDVPGRMTILGYL